MAIFVWKNIYLICDIGNKQRLVISYCFLFGFLYIFTILFLFCGKKSFEVFI